MLLMPSATNHIKFVTVKSICFDMLELVNVGRILQAVKERVTATPSRVSQQLLWESDCAHLASTWVRIIHHKKPIEL